MNQSHLLGSGMPYDRRPAKWTPLKVYQVTIFFGLCCFGLIEFANPLWDPHLRQFTLMLGLIGVWRYCWWFTHAIRAEIFLRHRFPLIRNEASRLWANGWRPRGLHVMVTTFNEDRETSERMLQSIINEHVLTGLPVTMWLGSACEHDELLYSSYLSQHARNLEIDLNIIRQNQPGKRMAIGSVLRAMSRAGVGEEELVIFMDGDSILSTGTFQKCLSLFAARPGLQALTTNEEVFCFGPRWVEQWLKMRFAQRRLAMQSHALSGKVLTLTGRMSVFRASHILKHDFIRILEADHLDHWLWGRFRFLSGDDKSTWYYLLARGAEMLYVPDALVYTVERIDGSGIDRMTQNFRRWSGNMLRNGSRAIALGPERVGLFIWWCLLDQRIAMWTTLISPIVATAISLVVDSRFVVAYLVWIVFSRLVLSLCLTRYSKEVILSWPILLYVNQLLNAVVKVYCLFRLSRQRWSNRGNQRSDQDDDWFKNMMASYTTVVWVSALVMFVIFYTGVLSHPDLLRVQHLLS